MNMVWHLLWKDIRRFKWWLVAWFVLVGINLPPSPAITFNFEPSFMLSLKFASLLTDVLQMLFIISVVQEDALMDPAAFWRTRPTSSGMIFASKTLFIFLLIFLPQIAGLALKFSLCNISAVDIALICIPKIIGILILILSAWLAALYTRRLSSAAILFLGVYCGYVALNVIVHIIPNLLLLSFNNPNITEFVYLFASKWLIQDAFLCIMAGIIITFCYFKLPNIRRPIIAVCAALIIALVLGGQWNKIIVTEKLLQWQDHGCSKKETMLTLPPRLPEYAKLPDFEWQENGMKKTLIGFLLGHHWPKQKTNNVTAKISFKQGLNPRILPVNNGYIITAADNSFQFQGATLTGDASLFARCIRFDFNGKTKWEKEYAPQKHQGFIDGRCCAICPASGGGFLLGGFQKKTEKPGQTESSKGDESAWLWKIDGDGKLLWEKLVGNGTYQRINSLISISNNEYVSCGVITPQNQKAGNVWIAKFDAAGNILWEKNYGGRKTSWGFDIQSAPDGGYAACGYTTGTNGHITAWLLKLDKDGNLIWDKTFAADSESDVFSVMPAIDGGYVLRGWKKTVESGMKGWIFKTDATGNLIWEKTFDGSIDANCPAHAGGYFIAGRKDKNAWLAKLDTDGSMKYEKTFQEANSIWCVKRLQNGEYLAVGNAPGIPLWFYKFRDEKSKVTSVVAWFKTGLQSCRDFACKWLDWKRARD